MESTPVTDECAICIEPFCGNENTLELSCKHTFHFECLVEVLNSSLQERKDFKCPLCRNIEISKESEQFKTLRAHYIKVHGQSSRLEIIVDNLDEFDDFDENEDYHQWVPGWLERQHQERQQGNRRQSFHKCFNVSFLLASLCIIPVVCLLIGMLIFIVLYMTS